MSMFMRPLCVALRWRQQRQSTDMTRHGVTFVIDGPQLYVYLVTPTPKHEDGSPILKTTESRYLVTYEIYPRNTYTKR